MGAFRPQRKEKVVKEADKKKVLENKIRLAAVQIIKDSFGLLGAEAYNPLVVGIKTLIKEKKIDSAKGAAEMLSLIHI